MIPIHKFADIGEALSRCADFPDSVPVAGVDSEGPFYAVGRVIPKCWGGLSTLRVNGIMMFGNPAIEFKNNPPQKETP